MGCIFKFLRTVYSVKKVAILQKNRSHGGMSEKALVQAAFQESLPCKSYRGLRGLVKVQNVLCVYETFGSKITISKIY